MWLERILASRTTRAVELSAMFTEERHRVLAENVANIDTPDYATRRLDRDAFQKSLRAALEQSRGDRMQRLELRDNAQFSLDRGGHPQARPQVSPAAKRPVPRWNQRPTGNTDVRRDTKRARAPIGTELASLSVRRVDKRHSRQDRMIDAFDISTSALTAQRTRLDVIAGNIANAHVTRQADGSSVPYRRRFVEFMSGDRQGGPGVQVSAIRKIRASSRRATTQRIRTPTGAVSFNCRTSASRWNTSMRWRPRGPMRPTWQS